MSYLTQSAPRLLASGTLSNSAADICGAQAGRFAVTNVTFNNTNTTTARTVTVYSYNGTTTRQMYVQTLPALGTFEISSAIGFDGASGEELQAKMDTADADVTFSTYGG